jgi:hypothetical protein
MEMVTVESSMISAVGYDEAGEILEVVFNSGSIYRYSGVPKDVYEGLLAADSKGSFMHNNILDVYPYTRPSSRRRR